MDNQLLLTIQYVCNAENVKIPWNKVGAVMGQKISGGAVVQHLAKLRTRMVNAKVEVPPSLRRGGGTVASTGSSGGRSQTTPSKTSRLALKKGQADIAVDNEEEDENDYDVDEASDPEGDFEQAHSKRPKRDSTTRGWTKVKKEESDEEFYTPSKDGKKRKRNTPSKTDMGAKNKTGDTKVSAQTKSKGRSKKLPTGDKEQNEDSFEDDDQEKSEDIHSEQENEDVHYVGSGAAFLRLDPRTGSAMKQGEPRTPSKILKLPLPSRGRNNKDCPETPEYSGPLESESESSENFDRDTESHSDVEADTMTAGLETTDNQFSEEVLGTGLASQYPDGYVNYHTTNTDIDDPFVSGAPAEDNLFQSSQTFDGYSFNDAIPCANVDQGLPFSQSFDSSLNNTFDHSDVGRGFIVNQDFGSQLNNNFVRDNVGQSLPISQDYDSSFDTAFDHSHVGQDFTVNQDFGSLVNDTLDHSNLGQNFVVGRDFGNSLNDTFENTNADQDFTADQAFGSFRSCLNSPQDSGPLFSGPASSQYVYPSQGAYTNGGAPITSFSSSGYGAQGTAYNYRPTLDTNFSLSSRNQGPRQYGANDKGSVTYNSNFAFPSEPSRPTVVTRQANQPSVCSEPFSATSTNYNPTPLVASAGDAGTPLLNSAGQEIGAEFDHLSMLDIKFDDFTAQWDTDYSTALREGEGNGGAA